MPHTRPGRSKVRALAERAVKGKLIAVLGSAGAVLLIAIVTMSVFFSAAALPAQVIKEPIRWLFGSSTETATNPNPGDTDDLRTCLGTDSAVLEAIIRSVPATNDPELARAWILQALAHPDTTVLDSPTESTVPVETSDAAATMTFTVFADRWSTLASSTDRAPSGGDRIDAVPVELTALDPATDFGPFATAAMVSVLELSYRGTISMDEALTSSMSAEVADRCGATPRKSTG